MNNYHSNPYYVNRFQKGFVTKIFWIYFWSDLIQFVCVTDPVVYSRTSPGLTSPAPPSPSTRLSSPCHSSWDSSLLMETRIVCWRNYSWKCCPTLMIHIQMVLMKSCSMMMKYLPKVARVKMHWLQLFLKLPLFSPSLATTVLCPSC